MTVEEATAEKIDAALKHAGLDELGRRRAPSAAAMNQVRKADPNNKTVAENRKARFS